MYTMNELQSATSDLFRLPFDSCQTTICLVALPTGLPQKVNIRITVAKNAKRMPGRKHKRGLRHRYKYEATHEISEPNILCLFRLRATHL